MKNYLPIGTIVQLQNASSRLMIIGININNEDETGEVKNYDYIAVGYPEGFLDKDQMYLFNSSSIERVDFVGYDDDERHELFERIEAAQRENQEEDYSSWGQ